MDKIPTKQPLPTHDYRVRTKTEPELTIPVHAAYFRRMDNEFLEFKDADQKTIYVIAIDAVLDVVRVDPTATPTTVIKVSGNPTEAEIASIKARLLP